MTKTQFHFHNFVILWFWWTTTWFKHKIKKRQTTKIRSLAGAKLGTVVYPWECKADLSILAVNSSRFSFGLTGFSSDRKTKRPSTYNQVENTKDGFSLFFTVSDWENFVWPAARSLLLRVHTHTILCYNIQQCNQCRKEVFFFLTFSLYNARAPCTYATLPHWSSRTE